MWFRKAFSALACVSGLTFALACSSDEQDNSAVPSSSVSSKDLNTFRARISAAASSHFDQSLRATKDLSSMIDLFAKDPSAANLALARSAWSRSLFDLEQAMAFAFPSSVLDSEGNNEALLVIGPSYNSSDIEVIINDKVKYPGITSGILKSVNAAESGHEIMGYNALEYLLFNSNDLEPWQDKRRLEYLQAVVSVLVDVATDANNDWVEGGPSKRNVVF